jgi:signal transduction histidine kinase
MREETLDLIAAKATEKKLDLVYDLDERVPGIIVGDNNRLRQILLNLLSNAIKFTDQGEVFLEIKLVPDFCQNSSALNSGATATAFPPDSPAVRLQFSVHDTGIGIPTDKLDRLFKSFSQVDSTTTRQFGGTGLGLSNSKKLVELMNGLIWVESTADRGSAFHFTLTAHPDQQFIGYFKPKEDVCRSSTTMPPNDGSACDRKVGNGRDNR